jgi:hypothetical protein
MIDPMVTSALSAIAGTGAGAFAGTLTTWISLRAKERSQSQRRMLSRKEALYSEFIEEASVRFTEALTHNLEEPSKLVRFYALVSKLRLVGSPEVIALAEEVMRGIVDQYDRPNDGFHLPTEEDEARDIDILRRFSEACREDLDK